MPWLRLDGDSAGICQETDGRAFHIADSDDDQVRYHGRLQTLGCLVAGGNRDGLHGLTHCPSPDRFDLGRPDITNAPSDGAGACYQGSLRVVRKVLGRQG